MKIIDLLNKIANDEEVPRKFKYENTTFIYSDNVGEYFDEKEGNSFNYTFDITDYDVLNDEIEIIEDKPFSKRVEEIYNRHIDYIYNKEDKKIEKLNLDYILDNDISKYFGNKINEIINHINKENNNANKNK